MLSVIVPAHNEETVIARGLRAIVTGAQPDELEVIVACNGCTDRTAEIARTFGPPVRVIELDQASKVAALNAAEEIATGFPRFYVDADVVVDLASLRAMAAALAAGPFHCVTPGVDVDLSRASWAVRAYYRVWLNLPYNQAGGQVGTGVYALSRTGRARFGRFPEVTNDDGYIRFLFAAGERGCIPAARSRTTPPRTIAGLLRAKTRVRRGRLELASRYPAMTFTDHAAGEPLARWLLRRPDVWPHITVYIAVELATRYFARRQFRKKTNSWGRDDSRQ